MVEDYLRTFAQIRQSGERVIIDGPCLSACTLVLSTIPKSRICVTRRAILGFHAAQWVELTKRPRVARTGGDAYRDPVLSAGSSCVDQEARRAYGETDLPQRTGARVLVSAVLSRHLRMDRYEPTGRCIELPGEFCKRRLKCTILSSWAPSCSRLLFAAGLVRLMQVLGQVTRPTRQELATIRGTMDTPVPAAHSRYANIRDGGHTNFGRPACGALPILTRARARTT